MTWAPRVSPRRQAVRELITVRSAITRFVRQPEQANRLELAAIVLAANRLLAEINAVTSNKSLSSILSRDHSDMQE